jgi:hypothetical protein
MIIIIIILISFFKIDTRKAAQKGRQHGQNNKMQSEADFKASSTTLIMH